MPKTKFNVTQEEIDTVVKILKKLEPGFLPFEIFIENCRLLMTTALEVVPLRFNNGDIEILLQRRDANDPVWPNEWHTPGTIIRSTDDGLLSAFQRLMKDELEIIVDEKIFEELKYVANIFQPSPRGKILCLTHWYELDKDYSGPGEFFKVNNLPDGIVKCQLSFINQAVEHFKASKNLTRIFDTSNLRGNIAGVII